jgi:hypothetical protein
VEQSIEIPVRRLVIHRCIFGENTKPLEEKNRTILVNYNITIVVSEMKPA